jgi:hypothetical protein
MVPVPNVIKLFTSIIDEFSQRARVFVLGKPVQPGLMFMSEAKAYPSEGPFWCSALE